jgi:hypothetical protein
VCRRGVRASFFLRPVFTDRPLPLYLHLHGGVLTLWFALGLVQPALVAARRPALHRQLGVAGAVVAVILVPLSGLVAIRAIPRDVAAGVPPTEIQFIVVGDLLSLVVFSGLVARALWWRQHRDWRPRFMGVASIMIIGPAVARLERVGVAVPIPVVLLGLQQLPTADSPPLAVYGRRWPPDPPRLIRGRLAGRRASACQRMPAPRAARSLKEHTAQKLKALGIDPSSCE